MILGIVGCAAGKPGPAQAPREEIKVHFYLGAEEIGLKQSPDYGSAETGKVKLNERVEKLKYGEAGWFLVRTEDGRQGWINERYLKVDPVSEFFVRRWGVNLKAEPEGKSKTLSRLRINDQVKLLQQTPQGWGRVTVARTQENGWVELRYLSMERVVVKPVRRKPARTAKKDAEEVEEDPGAPEESQPSLLTPPPAKAEPPPVKTEPPPVKQAPGPPHVKPERFEPF